MIGTMEHHDAIEAALGDKDAQIFAGAGGTEVAATRLRDLEGLLARAAVMGRDRCVIVVPQLSAKTAMHLKAFIADYLPKLMAVLLVSRRGGSVCRLPSSSQVRVVPDNTSRRKVSNNISPASTAAERSGFGFSDASVWLVKILLLQQVDRQLWSGPQGPFRSIAELAERSGVAYSATHKTVSALRGRGWLSRSDELRIIAPRELLTTWLATLTLSPPNRTPVRGLFGTLRQRPTSSRKLALALGKAAGDETTAPWALSGWSTIQALNLNHVVGNTLHSVTTALSLDEALDQWSLQMVERRDAAFFLTTQASTRSTLAGRVRTPTGETVVDALQAALDVCTDANRGHEQAWHIISTLLPEVGA